MPDEFPLVPPDECPLVPPYEFPDEFPLVLTYEFPLVLLDNDCPAPKLDPTIMLDFLMLRDRREVKSLIASGDLVTESSQAIDHCRGDWQRYLRIEIGRD